MNKRIISFMAVMIISVFTVKVSYAGTDIINTVLLKAGNVIDKVSQKYEGISLKVRELTEGKMFALDENTADMLQKANDQKASIQEKIDKIRAAKEFAAQMDEAVLERYNDILSQLEASDTQARDVIKQRGWTFGKNNDEDNSDETHDYDDMDDDYIDSDSWSAADDNSKQDFGNNPEKVKVNIDLKQTNDLSKNDSLSNPSAFRKSFTAENTISKGTEKSNVAKN